MSNGIHGEDTRTHAKRIVPWDTNTTSKTRESQHVGIAFAEPATRQPSANGSGKARSNMAVGGFGVGGATGTGPSEVFNRLPFRNYREWGAGNLRAWVEGV